MITFQAVVAILIISSVYGQLSPPRCLTGQYHKQKPGPESSDYRACFAYKNNTCCTADFTRQLAVSPILKIGNFTWMTCGQSRFSKRCEDYMAEVECFYQCSPNVGYWKGVYPGSFVGVPICSSFCDTWFDACKDEVTCAKNWITDFTVFQGNNKCNTSRCMKFSEIYTNGSGLCNAMWGTSFKYTISKKANDCMNLKGLYNGTDQSLLKQNTMVAETYHSVHSAALALVVSNGVFGISVLLGTVFILNKDEF